MGEIVRPGTLPLLAAFPDLCPGDFEGRVLGHCKANRFIEGQFACFGESLPRSEEERQDDHESGCGSLPDTRSYDNEEHGHDEEREEHGEDESHRNDGGKGTPEGRTGKNHWGHAYRCGHCSKEYWPQTTLSGFCRCLLESMPLRDLLVNIIDEDDCISHHDAAYADKTYECHETEGVRGNKQSERRTKKR
ncbi:MAG: hypothetical protein A4E57_04368 [Syntrophorhabdaceae bacterium PtaU1.Bin034]|nr:MAG: hypothetical protein A4E57_04368 [Syntrophorhabdaceae bacterium PtaU1.Bin034]